MTYKIAKLSQTNALIIANEWKYPNEYAFYDMTADEEDYNDFISEANRGEQYFQVLKDNELIGFLSYETKNQTAEIGLGMKPHLTGKGNGIEFLNSCLNFITDTHSEIIAITLSVAEFNERAIKVYERIGFEKVELFKQETNGGIYDFVRMRKEVLK